MNTLSIGQVAKKSGVSVQTIRYYERFGLIPQVSRRRSGYRQYPADVVTRIKFIKQAQKAGFLLREIDELLSLKVQPGITCQAIKNRTQKKIDELDDKIRQAKRIRQSLVTLAESCSGSGPTSECPILSAFEVELFAESR